MPIGNFEVATGKVIAPTVQQTRDEADFAEHIEPTIATDPAAGWIFVADNLTTHCSATLVLLVAGLGSIPIDTLGTKGKSGVLKSVPTRKAFSTDASHRVRFAFVPKPTPWLNQVEIWFRALSRRVVRRGSFRSEEDLRDRILQFIDYFNRTMAKPYKWTYAGRPLNVRTWRPCRADGMRIRPGCTRAPRSPIFARSCGKPTDGRTSGSHSGTIVTSNRARPVGISFGSENVTSRVHGTSITN